MMTGVESLSPPFKTHCMVLRARVMEAAQGNAPDPVNAVTICQVPDAALTVLGNANIVNLAEIITEKATTETEVAPEKEIIDVKKNTMMKVEAVTNMNTVQENLDPEEKVNHDQKEEMTWNVEDQNEQEKKIQSAKDPDTDDPKADQYSMMIQKLISTLQTPTVIFSLFVLLMYIM